MDLSNLSNTLPHSKPLSHRKIDSNRKQEREQEQEEDEDGVAKSSSSPIPSSTSTSTSTSTSSQASLADYADLTSNFKDAAKAIASLYNTALNMSKQNAGEPDDPSSSLSTILKTEFSNAARSVASLYKMGQTTHAKSYEQGSLDCIDELLQVLTNDEDVENWALTRRAEIINNNKKKDASNTAISSSQVSNTSNLAAAAAAAAAMPTSPTTTGFTNDLEGFKIPHDFEFQYTSDLKPPVPIRPSIPPISIQHNLSQRNPIVNKKNRLLHQQMYKKFYSSEDSSESEGDDNNNSSRRIKVFKDHSNSPAKKKSKKK
ncbi:uncharacterized protein LODBEIA_P15500 [Lodderomyces beijingensis]|uniref:Uncharacterized protein n=1 Tax=Lodderomyces beijingensis TaxID=1775926 RepID=A0ABP0ZJK5_9ASCO